MRKNSGYVVVKLLGFVGKSANVLNNYLGSNNLLVDKSSSIAWFNPQFSSVFYKLFLREFLSVKWLFLPILHKPYYNNLLSLNNLVVEVI